MNKRFFNLSSERQKAIINAGCRGFSKYGYNKSSMSEIAMEAGISKSLLLHYFKNKKEFYLYLFNYAMQITMQIAKEELLFQKQIFLKFSYNLHGSKADY